MKNADPGSSGRRSAFKGEMRAVLLVYASRRGGSYLAYSGALALPSMTARSHRRKLAVGYPAGRDVVGGAVFGDAIAKSGQRRHRHLEPMRRLHAG
jgi:hypothetical protein